MKLLDIGESDVLDFFAFNLQAGLPDCVAVPVLEGVPDGAVIERVSHDPWVRVFRFLVSHPSFPEVPDGEHPPRLEGGGFTRRQVVYLKGVNPNSAAHEYRGEVTDLPHVV